MKVTYPSEWRTQSRSMRRFYAKYMTWLERLGYVVVVCVLGGFVFAFNYRVEEVVSQDKVKVELAAQTLAPSQPYVVVRSYADPKAVLTKGAPVVDIVVGPAARQASLAVLCKAQGIPGPAMPPVETVVADHGGVLLYDEEKVGLLQAAEAEFGKVVDLSNLTVRAVLSGASVARATIEGECKVTNVVVEPSAGVVVRLQSPEGTRISGQIVGKDAKKQAENLLRSASFKVRDDLGFQTSSLSELQVEYKPGPVAGSAATMADPDPRLVVRAKVVKGEHKAEVQVADFPPSLAAALRDVFNQRLAGKSLSTPEGGPQAFGTDARFIAKLKVKTGGEPGALRLPATALSHSFEVTADLIDPPAQLLEAVRQATLEGKSVTARVELRTGSRPLALILLKKS